MDKMKVSGFGVVVVLVVGRSSAGSCIRRTHNTQPQTNKKNIEFQMQTMMVDASFCCCCRIAYKECRLRGELVEPAPKLRDCVLCSERASKRRTIAMARVCCALLESAVK